MKCELCKAGAPLTPSGNWHRLTEGAADVPLRERLCLRKVAHTRATGCGGKAEYTFTTPVGLFVGYGRTVAEAWAAKVPVQSPQDAVWIGWARVGPKCQALVERVLAAQGPAAEPELVSLQHELVELNSAMDSDIPF